MMPTLPTLPTGFAATDAVKGIDLNHYQGTVDWTRIANAGISFSYAKATEGITFVDPGFTANNTGSLASGLFTGAYHFFRPKDDATRQANAFLQQVPALLSKSLPPALDVEVSDGVDGATILAGVKTWLQVVEDALGVPPILYVGTDFWNEHVGGSSDLDTTYLWLPEYTFATSPSLPNGLDKLAFWQFTSSGSVDGITGLVDLNRFVGTLAELQALAVS